MLFWIKICSLIVLLFFISSCADYKPVIDFRGSEKKGADLERYNDDLSSCKKLAKQTIPGSQHNIEKVLILPEFTERGLIIKKCLAGRGWYVVR